MLDQIVRIKSVWDRPETIPGKELYAMARDHIKALIDIAWEQEKRIQILENEKYNHLTTGGNYGPDSRTARKSK